MKNDHGRDLTGKEIAQMLDEWANGAQEEDVNLFLETLVFRTHRTLQQKIFGVFLRLAEKYSTLTQAQYDLRNEHTVKMAKKICQHLDKYDRNMPLV